MKKVKKKTVTKAMNSQYIYFRDSNNNPLTCYALHVEKEKNGILYIRVSSAYSNGKKSMCKSLMRKISRGRLDKIIVYYSLIQSLKDDSGHYSDYLNKRFHTYFGGSNSEGQLFTMSSGKYSTTIRTTNVDERIIKRMLYKALSSQRRMKDAAIVFREYMESYLASPERTLKALDISALSIAGA